MIIPKKDYANYNCHECNKEVVITLHSTNDKKMKTIPVMEDCDSLLDCGLADNSTGRYDVKDCHIFGKTLPEIRKEETM